MFDTEGYKEMVTPALHNRDVLTKLLGTELVVSV